jgi:hypothetical protein
MKLNVIDDLKFIILDFGVRYLPDLETNSEMATHT